MSKQITDNHKKNLDDLLASLSPKEKDVLYRKLWFEHVLEDVQSFAETEDLEITDEIAKQVADRYVYNGDYDCNLSYWDNINNLVKECIENE